MLNATDNAIILVALLVCAIVAVLSIMRQTPPPRTRFTERDRDEIRALIRHELLIEMALTGEDRFLERTQNALELDDGAQVKFKLGRSEDGL